MANYIEGTLTHNANNFKFGDCCLEKEKRKNKNKWTRNLDLVSWLRDLDLLVESERKNEPIILIVDFAGLVLSDWKRFQLDISWMFGTRTQPDETLERYKNTIALEFDRMSQPHQVNKNWLRSLNELESAKCRLTSQTLTDCTFAKGSFLYSRKKKIMPDGSPAYVNDLI